MTETTEKTERSPLLPTDEYDIKLRDLIGHPDGAHTHPTLVHAVDDYGNVTDFTVRTVKWAAGTTVFIKQVKGEQARAFVLPPNVVRVLLRQQETVAAIVRRRHGKRLAADRKAAGIVTTFTPEQRRKALATRKAKAKARRARKAAKGGAQ